MHNVCITRHESYHASCFCNITHVCWLLVHVHARMTGAHALASTFLSHGAVMCVCVCVITVYKNFYECFLRLFVFVCRCV